MANANPYYEQIAETEAVIATLQSQWASLNSQWLPYTQAGDYTDPTGQRILAERDAVTAQIEQKRRTLEQLRDAAAKFDAAVTANVASGMTPEAAGIAAQANVEAAKARASTMKVVAYVVGALVLLAAVVYAWRYLKKKKA